MGDPTAWAILDALEVAVFVTDCEGMIRHRNAAAAAMLLQGDDVGAAFDRCRLSPDFQGWAAEIRRIIDQGASRRLDGRLPADGAAEPRLVTLHCTPLIGPGSRGVAGVVIAIRLEPDRETSSERLEMAQRLASLGKLAARVAHELNNPLDGILRYVNLSLRLADSAGGSK